MSYLYQWIAIGIIAGSAFLFGIWGATSETARQRLFFRMASFTFAFAAMFMGLVLHYGYLILLIDNPIFMVKGSFYRPDGYILERHYFQLVYLLLPAAVTFAGYVTGRSLQEWLRRELLKEARLG